VSSAMVILTAALAPLLGAAIVVNPSAASSLARPHRSRITRATATGRATATAPSWQLASTLSTIDALERTGGARPHSLLTGLFDEASGLCSEGVWHNSWLGVGRLLAARELRREGDNELADEQLRAAQTLGESLYCLSFDGARGGFRRRSASGFWKSATEGEARRAIVDAGEDPGFYELSDETRCVSSGAAVIFFSLLAEAAAEAAASTAAGAAAEAEAAAEAAAAAARSVEVGSAFTAEFFDEVTCRFRRVGDAMGEATGEATGEAAGEAEGVGEGAQYWRAADQAIGCLACLRLAKAGLPPPPPSDSTSPTSTPPPPLLRQHLRLHLRAGHDTAMTRAMAGCAVDSLLR
jgi:hypothetical protein